MKPEQLEFDLVHPSFGDDAFVRSLQDQALALSRAADEKQFAASVEGRLLFEDSIIPVPADDLRELRALVGPADWKKNQNRYQRMAAKKPRRFRRSLVALKLLIFNNLK
jgi:hypothetical protein